jgi:hypothetical protein
MAARKHLLTTAAVLALVACSDPAGVTADGVSVRVETDGLVMENRRAEKIFYLVMDQGALALALWAPCVRPDCPAIAPGETTRIDKPDVLGWGDSDILVAHWWQVVTGPGGEPKAGSVRSIQVTY